MGAISEVQERITGSAARASSERGQSLFRLEDKRATRVARGLGWFSIGLGVTELIMPQAIGRITGTRNHHGLIRSYGLREIAAGIGILSAAEPAGWLWSRVAGDALDLLSLGKVMQSAGKRRQKAVFGAAAVAGVTALDVWCARTLSDGLGRSKYDSRAEASMIVNRPPEECYAFWRNFESLPKFMHHLHSVRATGDRSSHWVARLPGGGQVEWDAEVTDEKPNERIAWQSRPGSDVQQTGAVEFEEAPAGRGTIVRVSMDYSAPGSQIASAFASLMGKDPGQMIRKELRRFKQAIETGEVITTEGQPAGRRSSTTWLDEMAR